jgi:hypothetical protein
MGPSATVFWALMLDVWGWLVAGIGLKEPIAHFIVNEYNRCVRAGEVFLPGACYAGFIEGFERRVKRVEKSFYEVHPAANGPKPFLQAGPPLVV